jgi:hypothetical protein
MLKHVLLQPCSPEPIKWYEPADRRTRTFSINSPTSPLATLNTSPTLGLGATKFPTLSRMVGILCHQCANRELERTLDPDDAQFHVVGEFINYEDSDLYCDHCGRRIESAYGED